MLISFSRKQEQNSKYLSSLRWPIYNLQRANTWNVSFRNYLQWPIALLQFPAPYWTCNCAQVRTRLGLTCVISLWALLVKFICGQVKLFDFLGKWMVLAEILIKLMLLLKRKKSSVPLFVVQIHFMAPMVCLQAFTSSSLCMEACIFVKYLSLNTYFILCESWMRVTIVEN